MSSSATTTVGGGQLPPGVSTTFEDGSDGTVLSGTQNLAIQKGQSLLYCVGYIHYADSVPRIRTTAFCRVLQFPEFATSWVNTGRFRVSDDRDYEYQS
jgi:hypothetical protein